VVLSINNVVLDGATKVKANLPAWFPTPLQDQHLAGNWLWGIAELLDVPILVLLFIRWTRQDKREAKKIDELTDQEMDALLAEHLRGPRR
jgi:cytochrome c oxidase assembly factor CtaG